MIKALLVLSIVACLWLIFKPGYDETIFEIEEKNPSTSPLTAENFEATPTPMIPRQIHRNDESLEPETQRGSIEDSEALTGNLDEEQYGQKSRHVVARPHGEHWVIQGDILIDAKHLLKVETHSHFKIAEVPLPAYWHEGVVPYVITPGVNVSNILEAVKELNSLTHARFVERSSETDYVVFQAASEKDCLSKLGRQGGKQEIILHASCSKGAILHEMMHALGFVHEQSREDRDNHVKVLWENIEPPRKTQFQKFPASISQPVPSNFDFESILLYDSFAFTHNKKPTLVTLDDSTFNTTHHRLSDIDIEKINAICVLE